MKKQFKTKLILNSQCIRTLRGPGLREVQGGIIRENTDACPTDACTEACTAACSGGCRACG